MNVSGHLLLALANSVWQSALLATAAWLVLRCIRHSTAALRYALWSAVLVATAMLPFIDMDLPARIVLVSAPAPAQATTLRPAVFPAPAVHFANQPVPPENPALGKITAHTGAAVAAADPHMNVESSPVSPAPAVLTMSALRSAAGVTESWLSRNAIFFLVAYALVASLMTLRVCFGLWRLRAIKRGLTRIEHPRIASACRKVARPVWVGASADVDCPCVIGYVRPVIALPSELIDELEPDDLARVLAHELGHVRRMDDWANLIAQCIRALWFFNPVVHVACRALDVDREIACDDLAAAARAERIDYAKCLAEMAQRTTFSEHLMPAAGFFPDRRQIIVRIEQLLDRNHAGSSRIGVAAVAAGIAAAAGVLALARYQVPAYAITVAKAIAAPSAVSTASTKNEPVPARAPKPLVQEPKVSGASAMAQARRAVTQIAPAPIVVAARALERSGQTWVAAPPATLSNTLLQSTAPYALAIRAEIARGQSATQRQDPTSDLLDALAAAGYTHLSINDLIAVRNAGVGPDYLRALKQFGVAPMSVDKLIALANAGVSPGLLAGLHGAGYADLSPDDLIALTNAGINANYVTAIAKSGRRPAVGDLVALQNAGVSAMFIDTLSKNGYARLSTNSLISLANAGVTSLFLIQMAKEGYAGLDVSELIALANAGVSPMYVKSLADAGYTKLSPNDLIRLMNAGVSATMIKNLRSHGIPNSGQLSVDDLIKLANEGFQA